MVEKFLQIHAVDEAPGYFLGSQYSYAEAAISPFVRRYSVVSPPPPPPPASLQSNGTVALPGFQS